MKQPDGKCECGGQLVLLVAHPEPTAPGAVKGGVCCSDCDRIVKFLVPDQAAIDRGRELAERYGW